jgi:hypothetical protein
VFEKSELAELRERISRVTQATLAGGDTGERLAQLIGQSVVGFDFPADFTCEGFLSWSEADKMRYEIYHTIMQKMRKQPWEFEWPFTSERRQVCFEIQVQLQGRGFYVIVLDRQDPNRARLKMQVYAISPV